MPRTHMVVLTPFSLDCTLFKSYIEFLLHLSACEVKLQNGDFALIWLNYSVVSFTVTSE